MMKTLTKFIRKIKSCFYAIKGYSNAIKISFNKVKMSFNNACVSLVEKIISAKKNLKPMKFRYLKKSYSQDGEDLFMMSFFEDSEDYKGFYVDIGAFHPYRFSNTQAFYEKGWRGINIDATPKSMHLFKKYRSKDINIECAISDSQGELSYYSFEEAALNTFDEKLANEYVNEGWELKEKVTLQTCLINDILENNLPKDRKIDFINMDIEGLELKILKSFNFEKYAPDYFLIEELDYINNDFVESFNSEIFKLLSSKDYQVIGKRNRTVFYKKSDGGN